MLTLDLDAGTADVAVVGHVDAGDTGSAFSYATDLLAVDIPTDESAKSVVDEPGPARDSGGSSTLDRTGLSDHPWLALGAVGLAVGAALRDDSPAEGHLSAAPATRHGCARISKPRQARELGHAQ